MKRVVGVLCAVACLSASCGGKTDIKQVVAASADHTIDAKTAKIEVTSTVDGPTPATSVSKGVIDFTTRRASLTVKVGNQSVKTVTDGQSIFEDLGDDVGLPDGKSWLKLTLADIGKAAGLEGLGELSSSQNDPSSELNYLRGAGEVTKLGTEDVRGEKTTRYHAVVSFEEAAQKASAAAAKTIRSIAKKLGQTTQPIDVWIDSDGRVRRLTEKIDLSKADLPAADGAQPPTSTTVKAEYYDFGTTAKVELPSADDVAMFSDVFGDETDNGDGSGSGTPTADTNALEPKIIKTVLPGYTQETDDVGDTGPSDLEKAVRDDGEDDAREALTSAGFVAGYQRLWTKGDNEIIDFVYQFKSAAGAQKYRDRAEEGAEQGGDGTTVTTFAVPTIPGAKGFVATDGNDKSVVVSYTRGVYTVQVILNGTDATEANATQVAKAQYDKLG